MKKKVKATKPAESGTILVYDDGTEEYMDGVNVTLKPSSKAFDDDDVDRIEEDEDSEEMMSELKKKRM